MPVRNSRMQASTLSAPRKSRFAAVLFDLDGTLADTIPTVTRLYTQVLQQYTGRTWQPHELHAYFGPPEDGIFRQIVNDESLVQEMLAAYFALTQTHGASFIAFPDMRELLANCQADGVKLGVYTSGVTEAALMRLTNAGLRDFFPVIIGGDQVTNYKPHPEGLHKLMDALNVTPTEAIFIGDSPLDIQAGKSAGMTTAGVLWGISQHATLAAAAADHLCDHTDHLHNVIYSS
jgi:pyrophosphatase PpaX